MDKEQMKNRQKISGGELFIVDNSDADWKMRQYLHNWANISKYIQVENNAFTPACDMVVICLFTGRYGTIRLRMKFLNYNPLMKCQVTKLCLVL